MRHTIAAILLLILSNAAVAATFSGQVVGVTDGDTIAVLVDGRQQVKVRLSEIDAPEKGQPYGTRSRQALSDLCYGRAAEIDDGGRDRYGRVVGRVRCAGKDASAEQVRAGMAWVFDRYAKDRNLYRLQDSARTAGRGLWADAAPVPPWEWRKAKR